MSKRAGTILVVDDEPENLNVLEALLAREHFNVTLFPGAELAWRAAREIRPDLFLLDIRMPDVDGYELYRRIRQDVELAETPVIFVSALNSREDILRGFAAGGVDYITKPFCAEEVVARSRTHIELRRARTELVRNHRDLAANYERLREVENLRDNLVHMLGHDMRSHLHSVLGHIEVVLSCSGSKLEEPDRLSMQMATEAAQALNRMVTQMVDVSRWEAGRMPLHPAPVDPGTLLAEAARSVAGMLRGREIRIATGPGTPLVLCDEDAVRRVVVNLVDNAVKHAPSTEPILLGAAAENGSVRFTVSDRGPGIPPDMIGKVFDKFVQADRTVRHANATSGLGLAYCKLAIEAHGGRIGVESRPARGCTFWFSLPRVPDAGGAPHAAPAQAAAPTDGHREED